MGIVVESTYNWYWLVDGLMEEGYKVHLANPSAIKQYEGLKYSDDVREAFFLAQLLKRYRPKLCVNSLAIKIIRAYPPNNK